MSEDCRFCEPDGTQCAWCITELIDRELLPQELYESYQDNYIVSAVFDSCRHRGLSREQALVWCVKELIKVNDFLTKDSITLTGVKSVVRTWDETGYALKLSILKEMVEE